MKDKRTQSDENLSLAVTQHRQAIIYYQVHGRDAKKIPRCAVLVEGNKMISSFSPETFAILIARPKSINFDVDKEPMLFIGVSVYGREKSEGEIDRPSRNVYFYRLIST